MEKKIVAHWSRITWLLAIPAMAALHTFVVYSLLSIGESRPVTTQENSWLNAALYITWSNPDVLAAKASYLRDQAVLPENVAQIQTPLIQNNLHQSLNYWAEAQKLRPNWPYYALAALDVEVMLNKPAKDIQQRIDLILAMAPNERGLDKLLLELSFMRWDMLTKIQKEFMLARLAKVKGGTLKFIFGIAKREQKQQIICVNLPWRKVKRLCTQP